MVVPGPATDRLGAIARDNGVWLTIGVQDGSRTAPRSTTPNLYFSPDGRRRREAPQARSHRLGAHRLGDGRRFDAAAVGTPFGRIGGLICWENYMPLARFHMYAQGIDLWPPRRWRPETAGSATMRHIARENRMFVVGVNPVLHVDGIPEDPHRERLAPASYVEATAVAEPGNTVIVVPTGEIVAGPIRERRRR